VVRQTNLFRERVCRLLQFWMQRGGSFFFNRPQKIPGPELRRQHLQLRVMRVQQLAHAQRSTLHDMGTSAPPAAAICDTCKCRRRLSCEEVTRDKQQGAAHARQPACL
jgi:hypothetical protein